MKIIRAKAQKMGAQISEEIVQFLADNISANVREIEGALSSLVANASFLGRKITTSLAKEILKAYVQLYQKEITIEHIIEVVCGYLALDPERFNSPERTREIAQENATSGHVFPFQFPNKHGPTQTRTAAAADEDAHGQH